MLPIEFPEKNFTYQKPAGMTDEDCSSLDVWKGQDASGNHVIISKWMPSYEDIQAINRGEGIYLWVYGQGLPPVLLDTESPFVKQEG